MSVEKVESESVWFELPDIQRGHPWDNEAEFIASLCVSLMNPDLKKHFDKLSEENRRHYIESLAALRAAIGAAAPKGADRLTMSRRITNTIHYLSQGK